MRAHISDFAHSCSRSCCFATLLGTHLAAAKEKSQPAPDWAVDAAKTPTPTNVGDASAVILFDEYLITVDEQNHAVERERYAVRILKPQGREYSHCAAEYDVDEKLNYFHSWTIAADGRQFQAMDTDFTDVGAYGDADMQFTERVPIREASGKRSRRGGCCETEQHLRPYMRRRGLGDPGPDSSCQRRRWSWLCRPAVIMRSRGVTSSRVKPVETEDNHLRWEIKDMPALDLENMHSTPPWEALAARMSVKWGDAAVKGTDNQWRAIGLWQDQLEEHRPDPTPEITAEAQELIAGAPDLYTKLSRITELHPEEHSLLRRLNAALAAGRRIMPATSIAIATATAKTRPRC